MVYVMCALLIISIVIMVLTALMIKKEIEWRRKQKKKGG